MQKLIEHLMRGGTYGHFWAKQSKRTMWWEVGSIPQWRDIGEDLYFGVHPSKVQKGPRNRTENTDIEAINCLYSDFDAKDFNNDKEVILDHIDDLELPPTVVVDSGGGYHVYWLFNEPVMLLTSELRATFSALQKRWAKEVGGDKGVNDLARVLRLPGTLNHKPEYEDGPRQVEILEVDYDQLYCVEDFEEILGLPEEPAESEERYPDPPEPNNIPLQELVDLIKASGQGAKFIRLAGGDDSGHDNDTSAADAALCQILAFWTGGDAEKIDQIFRASKRNRPKWEREDYRRRTITSALAHCKEYYRRPDGLLTASADDMGNARCVNAQFPNQILFTESTGWLWYTGTHWKSENAASRVKMAASETLKRRNQVAFKKDNSTIQRVSRKDSGRIASCLACLEPLLTVSISEFASSPDELNCLNGVVDLVTGTLNTHKPAQRFRYCLPAEYKPQSPATAWTDWLLDAVGGKQEVVDYLQMALGYSVTGRTREEVMFYIFGPARAGKGIFTETIQALLGGRPMSVEVGIENFMSSKHGTSSDGKFFLASLKDTRFVAASESKGKQWLDESKIKRWTGGNEVYARHLYQKHFGYRPQFHLWLTSNLPPKMDYEDDAAWSRVRVIHFPHGHLEDTDKKLKGDMRVPEVLEGLLVWIVEGAIKWYKLPRSGLKAPEVIARETSTARRALDYTQMWLDDSIFEITRRREDILSYRQVRDAYELWCMGADLKPRPLRYWKVDLEGKGMIQVGVSARGTLSDGSKKVARAVRGVRVKM